MDTYITSATIKRLRIEQEMTQTELAEKIGVTKSMIASRRKHGWTKERALTEPYVSKSEAGRRGKEVLLKRYSKANTIV